MVCKFDKSLLLALADGTIDSLARNFAEEHLKACADCQLDLAFFNAMDADLEDMLGHIELPPELSVMSNRVIENSLRKMNMASSDPTVIQVIKNYTSLTKATVDAVYLFRHNPYHRAIDWSIDTAVMLVNRPMKRMIRRRLQTINPLRRLMPS